MENELTVGLVHTVGPITAEFTNAEKRVLPRAMTRCIFEREKEPIRKYVRKQFTEVKART